jgi:hypothetical protein
LSSSISLSQSEEVQEVKKRKQRHPSLIKLTLH